MGWQPGHSVHTVTMGQPERLLQVLLKCAESSIQFCTLLKFARREPVNPLMMALRLSFDPPTGEPKRLPPAYRRFYDIRVAPVANCEVSYRSYECGFSAHKLLQHNPGGGGRNSRPIRLPIKNPGVLIYLAFKAQDCLIDAFRAAPARFVDRNRAKPFGLAQGVNRLVAGGHVDRLARLLRLAVSSLQQTHSIEFEHDFAWESCGLGMGGNDDESFHDYGILKEQNPVFVRTSTGTNLPQLSLSCFRLHRTSGQS